MNSQGFEKIYFLSRPLGLHRLLKLYNLAYYFITSLESVIVVVVPALSMSNHGFGILRQSCSQYRRKIYDH